MKQRRTSTSFSCCAGSLCGTTIGQPWSCCQSRADGRASASGRGAVHLEALDVIDRQARGERLDAIVQAEDEDAGDGEHERRGERERRPAAETAPAAEAEALARRRPAESAAHRARSASGGAGAQARRGARAPSSARRRARRSARSRHGGHAARCASTARRAAGVSSPSTYGASRSSSSPQVRISSAMLPSQLRRFAAVRPRRACSPSDSARRPREIRDITVPIGTSSTLAISAYDQFLDVAQPDRLAERVGQRVERRLQVRVERGAGQDLLRRLRPRARRRPPARPPRCLRRPGLRPSWRRTLRNVLWRIVNSHALRFVPGLELMGRAERLQIRVLHQILRVRRPAGQPQGRPIQAVDM